jgi:hypothetical protein
MDRKPRTLSAADITSAPAVSRRTMLGALGIGASIAAAAATGAVATHAQTTTPTPKPQRRDPCRDSDHGPSDTDGCGKPPIS